VKGLQAFLFWFPVLEDPAMKRNLYASAVLVVLLAGTGCHSANGSQTTIDQQNQSKTDSQLQKPAVGNPMWVRYTDNAEGAFSMDVPVGWQVEGGMYRFGYFDVRWMMDIRSLDGKVIIRINDPNVPPYVLPGPHSGPAGHAAIRPNMFQMVVDNFQEARTYADSYAKRRFKSVCTSLTPQEAEWMPTMPAGWQYAPGVHATQASVAFKCESSDGPRTAVVFARTSIQDNGLWLVDPIISILATGDRLPQAEVMTQKMIDSWEETPQWKTHQKEMTHIGLGEMQADFRDFMRRMAIYHQERTAAMNQQVSQFEKRMQQQSDQVTSFGNILTGVTNLYDPATGTSFQAMSGPKSNYYMNGMGVKINSNLDPGNGFHQVVNLGP
jgi:hypothetical protein